jgi:cell division protein FtsN
VQVGIYESRENANQVAQSLLASGFEASIVPFQREGKTLYRVQTLVTRDRAKAEALKNQLESRGFPAGCDESAVAFICPPKVPAPARATW